MKKFFMIAAVAAFTFSFAACSEAKKEANDAQVTMDELKETVDTTTQKVGNAVSEGATDLKDQAKSASEGAEKKAGNVIDNVKSDLKDAKNDASKKVDEVKGNVSKTATDIKNDVNKSLK